MLFQTSLALVAALAASSASAQRPSNTSICDYYTTALFKNNTGANQYTLLTALVNRAVIGNTSATTAGIAVPGILNPNGTYNGTAVNLAPYFSGALKSTNRGGNEGVSVNFLDGGGAAPIAAGMPANGTSSNQYALLTHLYEFFGALLGCTEYGMTGFPEYAGQASMYETHKFMVLDPNELAYFITQVGLSAASFGVAAADVQAAGGAIAKLFDNRCGPEVTVIPSQGAALQSTCTDPSCPLAANSTCANQATIAAPNTTSGQPLPSAAGGSGSGGSGGSSGSATGTAAAGATSRAAGGAAKDVASAAGLLGAVALGAFALI